MTQLRAKVTESQAEKLRDRIAALPFKLNYQEEQQGAALVALIGCTANQENTLRHVLQDIGVSVLELPE